MRILGPTLLDPSTPSFYHPRPEQDNLLKWDSPHTVVVSK